MRLLLDTHALIWFLHGDKQLSVRALELLLDNANTRFVSHASLWEIAIKSAQGMLQLGKPYPVLFPQGIYDNEFEILDFQFPHYYELLSLPMHHRDPFDRMLIAQAKADGLTILSTDRQFSLYDIPVIW